MISTSKNIPFGLKFVKDLPGVEQIGQYAPELEILIGHNGGPIASQADESAETTITTTTTTTSITTTVTTTWTTTSQC